MNKSPVISSDDDEEEIDKFMIQATLKPKDLLSNAIVDLRDEEEVKKHFVPSVPD